MLETVECDSWLVPSGGGPRASGRRRMTEEYDVSVAGSAPHALEAHDVLSARASTYFGGSNRKPETSRLQKTHIR
eukprot:4748658-Pyramimonas_sp.AAC.1